MISHATGKSQDGDEEWLRKAAEAIFGKEDTQHKQTLGLNSPLREDTQHKQTFGLNSHLRKDDEVSSGLEIS
ncbi:MAG: hypothetical protein ACFCVD_24220 [Nodosilinea sp.]